MTFGSYEDPAMPRSASTPHPDPAAASAASPPAGLDRNALRRQLRERRAEVAATLAAVGRADDLARLIVEVDAALARAARDDFGTCRYCGEPIGDEEMARHPLRDDCLCALDGDKLAALEHDLGRARRMQASFLPPERVCRAGWDVHYRYQPAGAVSGDYCDVVEREGWLYFLIGDVLGKGVAAAYVMAHLSAFVRATLDRAVPADDLVRRVDQYLRGRASADFVTLVCGRADARGVVEVCNAGHCPPLVARREGVMRLDVSGFPAGVDEAATYECTSITLSAGDAILLHTDGISEARNPSGAMYGAARIECTLRARRGVGPVGLAEACLRDVSAFRAGAPAADDVAIMVVQRRGDPPSPTGRG
jgi:sigma-B regulation protein RsbU (phosphoserine phosphatase)